MRRHLIAALIFLLAGSTAQANSSFGYNVDVSTDSYRVKLNFKFSPEVSLSQVIHDFRDPVLLSALNPTMEPGRLTEKDAEHSDSVLAFKVYGFHFEMLSHCQEKTAADGSRWERSCVLDPGALDGGKFMLSKSDEVSCERAQADGAVACELKIQGTLKKIPLTNPAKMTVRAKIQSLLNWGKFWMYVDTGSVSARLSNQLFDESELKRGIDRLLSEGLSEASKAGQDFHLSRISRFTRASPPEPARSKAPKSATLDAATGFQLDLDRKTGTELTRNSELKLYQNGDALQPILKLIQNSSHFALIQVLSLVCDSSTEPLIQALETKAKSGVDVRILIHRWYAHLDSACLSRLEKSGVAVVTGPMHASYYVNDLSELVIGSESIARMFFNSDGTNFLDRDMMLHARGAVATDALRDFLSVWDENRSDQDRDISKLSDFYRTRRRDEIAQGLRGESTEYHPWLAKPSGLCRFASQAPQGRNRAMEQLLNGVLAQAQKTVFFSGVKLDATSPWVERAKSKAQAGVKVDYLGNGWLGGNGELTMLADEWIARLNRIPLSGFGLAKGLTFLRDWDRDRLMKRNQAAAKAVLAPPEFRFWSYFDFVHYKAWSIDGTALWLGSANPDLDAITRYNEAGVLCWDPALAKDFEAQSRDDLAHSVPLSGP